MCGEHELSMSKSMYERVYAIMVSCGMSMCVHAYLCKAITMVFCGTVGCNRYRRCVVYVYEYVLMFVYVCVYISMCTYKYVSLFVYAIAMASCGTVGCNRRHEMDNWSNSWGQTYSDLSISNHHHQF